MIALAFAPLALALLSSVAAKDLAHRSKPQRAAHKLNAAERLRRSSPLLVSENDAAALARRDQEGEVTISVSGQGVHTASAIFASATHSSLGPVATVTISSSSAEAGIGAKVQGWWMVDSACSGDGLGKCLDAVGSDFAKSWEDAKVPSASSSSSSSSSSASSSSSSSSSSASSTSSHVSSSSSRATSSSRASSTHASSSSSSHVASSTHVSSSHAYSSSHSSSSSSEPSKTSSSTPAATSSSSSSSSDGSCPANRKRSPGEQFAVSGSRFNENALRAHNELRAQAGVGALEWSEELAKSATAWAAQCNWSHSNSASGENLAAGYPNVASAVREWGSDAASEQKAQALDAAVGKVGCAVQTCDFGEEEKDMFDFGPVKYYVCAYDVAVSA